MWAGVGFGLAEEQPAITGLDVIVSTVGKIEALYTSLNSVEK